jgi:2-oxoglutarate dehydrogenase E1 component
LSIWEAQFGDFANGAQIIIDQFISSAEQKWQRMSGLVMLLPHGYEGQGPEHSSARLERFLQLCAQDNLQVVNLTTPAQIFHALRRQVKRDYRKPLIVMSPKSLLRHPKVISSLDELANGQFNEILPDTTTPVKAVENLVLCSGKVYYDIMAHKETLEAKDADRVAVARVEQLYPLHEKKLVQVLKAYPKLKRIVWTQEEPKNMGGWSFMFPRLLDLVQKAGLQGVEVVYNGRTERASPATGSEKVHAAEQKEVVLGCFTAGEEPALKVAKASKAAK